MSVDVLFYLAALVFTVLGWFLRVAYEHDRQQAAAVRRILERDERDWGDGAA